MGLEAAAYDGYVAVFHYEILMIHFLHSQDNRIARDAIGLQLLEISIGGVREVERDFIILVMHIARKAVLSGELDHMEIEAVEMLQVGVGPYNLVATPLFLYLLLDILDLPLPVEIAVDGRFPAASHQKEEKQQKETDI